MVRNADGPTRSVAPLTYYSAVLTVHERLSGELCSAEAWVDVARTKPSGGRRRSQSIRPAPLYPAAERLEVLRGALESGSDSVE